MSSAAQLRTQTRKVLLALAMTSHTSARAYVSTVSTSAPESMPPTGERRPLCEVLAEDLLEAAEDVAAIERVLRRASDELDQIKRRPLASTTTQTLEDLHAEIVDRGRGWTALEVAIALRCTPTIVRKARLAAGLELERGHAVHVNGNGVDLGVQLLQYGMSVRAASTIVGVPRSTLHDHARRRSAS